MRTARCILNNQTYTAVDFHLSDGFSSRNHLVCSECGEAARYRSQGRDGRDACFFATHAEGCNCATLTYPSSTHDTNQERRIIVRFDTVMANASTHEQPTGGRADRTVVAQPGGSGTSTRASSRNLYSLLSELTADDDFISSGVTIEVPERGDYSVADLFVNFADVTADHIGSYHGYWGRIPSVGVDGDSLWLNTGASVDMSILVDVRFAEQFLQRYVAYDMEEIAGSHMLIFGTLLEARKNGKKYVEVSQMNQFVLRRPIRN